MAKDNSTSNGDRFSKSYKSGPVKVIFSAYTSHVRDPDTIKGMLANRYRQHPPRTERILGKSLKVFADYGLYFQHQVVMSGYIVDFYCPQRGIAIEIDGPHHERQRYADKMRDWHLSKRGVRVFRFDIKRLERLPDMIEDIASLLKLKPIEIEEVKEKATLLERYS